MSGSKQHLNFIFIFMTFIYIGHTLCHLPFYLPLALLYFPKRNRITEKCLLTAITITC
uniref:Uncharacterized protein n=1 Tax=Rhizophora mucronata TaxID=61149 RepID=A0A2P2MU82_RHIMU